MSRKQFKWIFTAAIAIFTIVTVLVVSSPGFLTTIGGTPRGASRFAILLALVPYWWMAFAAHRRQLPRELERYLEDFGTEKKA
ncbi:MAG: hypothetical protein LAO21_00360 [Acidobacteriia bacterium]|nr:hypothetical protein [Terriglobia bacterium]